MKKALLIIDLQNDFINNTNSPVYIPHGKNTAQNIKLVYNQFKTNSNHIIFIQTIHKYDKTNWGKIDIDTNRSYCIENTHGSQIIDEFKNCNDKIITKHTYSAFFKTKLEEYLIHNKIEQLYFSGLTTGCCVSSTARDAYYRNYELFFIADCLCSTKKEAHELELEFFKKSLGKVISSKNII